MLFGPGVTSGALDAFSLRNAVRSECRRVRIQRLSSIWGFELSSACCASTPKFAFIPEEIFT